MQTATAGLDNAEKIIRLLDPVKVLRRGSSITQHKGKILKDASCLRHGDHIDTTLFNGVIKSRVIGKTKEAEESEQGRAVDLFSGLERA
jgi:exodeoxyribonuclease VII large subunit